MAVKRKPPVVRDPNSGTYVVRPKPLRLYLPDIRTVVEYLMDHADTVQMEAGNATIDDVEDLRDATSDEIQSFQIVTSSPDLRVELWRERNRIACAGSNQEARTLAQDLANMLNRFGSFGARFTVPRTAGLIVTAVFAAALGTYVAINWDLIANRPEGISMLIVAAVGMSTLLLAPSGFVKGTKIVPLSRAEGRANVHNAWIAFGSGIGGGVVAVLVAGLLGIY